jgi:glycosyltransferase involved in cell wall biosynthesis
VRVALIGPTHPYKGGIAQHTTDLAHRLAARGHEVRVLSWSAQYPKRLYPGAQQTVDRPEMPPFPDTTYPLSWRRPDGWPRVGRRLRTQVDAVVLVVVTPIQAPAYLGILRGLGGRVPALALCHNVLPHERRRLDVPLTRAVLGRCAGVLVHTEAQAAQARELTSAPVTAAVMPPHLWPSVAADSAARSAAAGSADDSGAAASAGSAAEAGPHPGGDGHGPRRQVLFFGMVRPYKGLDVLLRALAAGPPDVRLVVAGEFWGGGEAAARELASSLGIAGRVDIRPGYVDAADVPALFAAADALVLPYRDGTATQNVQLAHMHGTPVVATRVGSLATAVRDGVDGLLVPPGDPADLAAALHRLYEPGTLAALRAKVEAPDTGAAWDAYLDAVVAALARPSS